MCSEFKVGAPEIEVVNLSSRLGHLLVSGETN